MTYEEKQKKLVYEIARYYGVRVYFHKRADSMAGLGYYKYRVVNNKSVETIHLKEGKPSRYVGVLFHELGHSYCVRNGKYKAYHNLSGGEWVNGTFKHTKEGLRELLRTGWQAECFVDRWAARELKKWFPRRTYISGYEKPDGRQWLWDNHLCWFSEELEYLKEQECKNK